MLRDVLTRLQRHSTEDMAMASAGLLLTLLVPLVAILLQCARQRYAERCLQGLELANVRRSNMEDQFDAKYDIPEHAPLEGPVRVKALYVHPVKSCAGVQVQRAMLTKTGFLYDRCFAMAAEVEDPEDPKKLLWKMLTQRKKPAMSQIKAQIWLSRQQDHSSGTESKDGGYVVLRFDDPDPPGWLDRVAAVIYNLDMNAVPQVTCILPLQLPDSSETSLRTFKIHDRLAKGCDMSYVPSVAAALPKLKKFLQVRPERGLAIMRCTPDTTVRTKKDLAPLDRIGTPALHGYTDGQPLNVNNVSSVRAVSALLPPENQPLNAVRFRANVWISGAPAYEEESWKRCRIVPKAALPRPRAKVAPCLSVVCRTSRCTMPNVNIETGTFEADLPLADKKNGKPQPSTTLVAHRMVESQNKSALGYLGMQCVPEDRDLQEARNQEQGLYVEVGDEIEVLERGVHLGGSTANEYE